MRIETKALLLLAFVQVATAVSAQEARRLQPPDGKAHSRLAAFDPPRRVLQFTEAQGPVDNPERGLSWTVDMLAETNLTRVRANRGVTLVRMLGKLDAWRESDIPENVLALIDTRLAGARPAGVKLILRFSYNDGPHPISEPDASLPWIKRHIEQLKPLLQRHADVIAWMEAGFIGAWGEWHNSTNGLDKDPVAKREVVMALMDALPAPRVIQLRTPAEMIALVGSSFTARDAHSGSVKSRLGHHNDCFLASDNDSGTYGRRPRSIEQDKALIAAYGKAAPIGGETCQPNPPRSQCPVALAELEQLGFSEISLAYHPDVVAEWQSGGCLDIMRDRLGYRLALEYVELPEQIVRGDDARITIRVRNSGFTAPMSSRPVFLVVEGRTRMAVPVAADPRKWTPGRSHVLEATMRLPPETRAGTYHVSLWMPDAADSLRNDPRYAIRLANDSVWHARTGLNRLADAVEVR